jgi:hypothetical protein
MQRRRNDPRYQAHEPPQPHGDEEWRSSAGEYRERSVERENSPDAVQQRRSMGMPAASEVRRREQRDG